MLPTIAIVGRPNVGKSTLFNCLTRSRDALVADMPGVTRDRIYGTAEFDSKSFIVIDTGGIIGDDEGIVGLTEKQSRLAMQEADALIFLVDAHDGLQAADEAIANQIRKMNKKVFLVMNKEDGVNPDVASAEFHTLALGEPSHISAVHRRGVTSLMKKIFEELNIEAVETEKLPSGIRVALVGRPNVGKSTLINRLLGEERVLAHDMPGTTRDSIFIPFEHRDQRYTLIDTAGVRRRARVKEEIEQISVVKTISAINASNVVIMVIDARENISEQDLKLLGLVLKEGRALIVAVNKWDGLSVYQREQVNKELDRRLQFVAFAKVHFISALHGTGVGDLYGLIQECYRSATKELKTAEITELLESAVEEHQPPLAKGRRIKLRYAHPGGTNPPTIVIHGNQVKKLPESYQRYLENYFRKKLRLVGTPIRIELRSGENPFAVN